jgi:H+/gluconate symporter-like permease
MIGILSVLLALALLIVLAYRGFSVLLLGPLSALVAVVFAPGAPLLASYTQVFMPAAGRFIVAYFPVFLLGAVFGKLMEDSGAARAIAQGFVRSLGGERAVLAVVLSCAVLTYGGVSLFVVAFAVYPIAAALFRAADVPKRLIPATIALGAFTFTMTALPGTPAIQNAIPMPYFGTTPFAAPGAGVLAAVIMFGLGMLWLGRRVHTLRAAGEGYGEPAEEPEAPLRRLRPHAEGEGFDVAELGPPPALGPPARAAADDSQKRTKAPATHGADRHVTAHADQPGVLAAATPIAIVIGMNLLLSTFVLPRLDTTYLAGAEYGATTLGAVLGLWSIIGALVAAIVVLLVMQAPRLRDAKASLDAGASAAVLPIFNTASMVGFGAVIAALPAFALISDAALTLGGTNPLISLAITVNVLAGITGSASGGMSIALSTLGEAFVAQAQSAGVAPELMHRVTSIATGGLDALPHNGAVITLLGICKLTHRAAYLDVFVVAAAVPIVALIAVIALATMLGSF